MDDATTPAEPPGGEAACPTQSQPAGEPKSFLTRCHKDPFLLGLIPAAIVYWLMSTTAQVR